MKISEESLSKKGWSKEEIKKTLRILEKAKKETHSKIKILDKSVYWIALMLMIFGNFAFSTFMVPLLVTINNFSLYFIIVLLAASFGVIMSIVIKDIENLESKHHILLLSIIPITGIINFFIVVNMVNANPLALSLDTHHNPFLIGIVYLIGLFVPFTYLVFEEKWKR
ncbi:MAG: hypothetical protein ABH828_02650 [archaeon]